MNNDFKPISVFEKLGIQEYAVEILKAGNNGDISHLQGFIELALVFEKNNIDKIILYLKIALF